MRTVEERNLGRSPQAMMQLVLVDLEHINLAIRLYVDLLKDRSRFLHVQEYFKVKTKFSELLKCLKLAGKKFLNFKTLANLYFIM